MRPIVVIGRYGCLLPRAWPVKAQPFGSVQRHAFTCSAFVFGEGRQRPECHSVFRTRQWPYGVYRPPIFKAPLPFPRLQYFYHRGPLAEIPPLGRIVVSVATGVIVFNALRPFLWTVVALVAGYYAYKNVLNFLHRRAGERYPPTLTDMISDRMGIPRPPKAALGPDPSGLGLLGSLFRGVMAPALRTLADANGHSQRLQESAMDCLRRHIRSTAPEDLTLVVGNIDAARAATPHSVMTASSFGDVGQGMNTQVEFTVTSAAGRNLIVQAVGSANGSTDSLTLTDVKVIDPVSGRHWDIPCRARGADGRPTVIDADFNEVPKGP
ncbi:uncharacterized protein SPPG_00432 [Spizellomyces punctatus DAOM BR117]|uniref:Uncharacterized protein n=1 Tax=Spizellomyces punctatus (strain DAOM BR117) TaxID=645134 RepID=A0A0L0HTQ6_SPIPD|nr:uncharacterized protein SPPG_00432 [Spizellomyces punctatus DAOM BR117]KND04726.1 hypothetical protein SPPG_00432 [Spizellomyces punctatus DAOM BR117]|eukprot:XP_016612765.1 hypothetical protein SPPG_00432 [Spizellomyces punctatus DAOM BR117]